MTDEDAIRRVIDTWARASKEGDLETLAQLMTDDVTFLTPGNAPMRGRDTFMAGFRNVATNLRFEVVSDVQEVSAAGDLGYAVTHLDVTMAARTAGDPTRRRGHVLSVFRKSPDGRWAIARDANMITAA